MLGTSNQSRQASGGVRYTMIYQDATSVPNETATATFNLSNPLPAGLVEEFGLRIVGTTAAAYPSAASLSELFTGIRITFNGDQWFNLQTQANVNTSNTVSRTGAFLQDIGGRVVEDTTALTTQDMTLWIPCGINVPSNSRFEIQLDYAVSASDFATANFEIWCKYGKSTNITVVGNMTSQNLAANTQTLMTVKIPSIKGATVAGIALQGESAVDNLSNVIVKPLGDFQYSPTYLRGISGASQNGYEFADLNDSNNELQFADKLAGYYFIPLYNLEIIDGSVSLLLNAAAPEFYTATPVLNLPTSGAGERTPRQTSGKATGSKGAILGRAEDV
tara:strand:+ start:1228 stop:2226 length:999 start_codon:yes stop_codon:yes gene_type:complete